MPFANHAKNTHLFTTKLRFHYFQKLFFVLQPPPARRHCKSKQFLLSRHALSALHVSKDACERTVI